MGAEQEQIVLTFLEYTRGQQQDVDALVGLMSDGFTHEVGVPSTPRVGRDAGRAELEHQNAMSTGLLPGSEILNVASNDRAVFVERIDVFDMGRKQITLQVNGVFEVKDGKIVAWRDYFDTADVASQLGIDVRDIVR